MSVKFPFFRKAQAGLTGFSIWFYLHELCHIYKEWSQPWNTSIILSSEERVHHDFFWYTFLIINEKIIKNIISQRNFMSKWFQRRIKSPRFNNSSNLSEAYVSGTILILWSILMQTLQQHHRRMQYHLKRPKPSRAIACTIRQDIESHSV